jgi:hypothetical protein
MPEFAEGIVLIVAAAFLQGLYALFLKFKRRWQWENFWSVFSVTALVFSPILTGVLLVPNMATVLSASPTSALAFPFVLWMLWCGKRAVRLIRGKNRRG